MTALDRYAKLEAVARYHAGQDVPAREVVLSFGERSLIIMGMNDEALAHWPLASLRALGPAETLPVELVPDPTSAERLVLDDREMAAAIREVCPDLHRAPPPQPRRRLPRGIVGAGVAAVLLGAAAMFIVPRLPDSLVDLVPVEREAVLGEAVAARLPALLSPVAPPGLCIAEEGVAALRALTDRLTPGAGLDWPLRVSVIDHPAADALALPGGRVLLFRGLLQASRSPEEIAAVIAHAIGHARVRDPMRATLGHAGAAALASVLVGDITDNTIVADTAAALDARYPPEAEARADAAAFAVLAEAGLPSLPYAEFADRLAGVGAGESARYLDRHPWTPDRSRAAADADAIGDDPFRPALPDRDWIALGNICDRIRPFDPAGY